MDAFTTNRLSRMQQCRKNAQLKSDQKRRAFLEALAAMVKEGKPIVKAQVCRRAGVTPPFVGKHPELQQALDDAQRKHLTSRAASEATTSAINSKDRMIEALKRQLDAKQAVINAKETAIREKDQSIRVLLGKLAANSPLTDTDLQRQLEDQTERAELLEQRVKDLENRLFARGYVRSAGKIDRKWHPSKKGGSHAKPAP